MQYVEGLRQAGCDVYWLEHFRGIGDPEGDGVSLSSFLARLERFGLGGKTILYSSKAQECEAGLPREIVGMSAADANAILESADLLLNFHYAIAPGLLARFRCTALVDIDPGLLQFWISRGQLSVPRHDFYFTTGETVGTPAALFPDCGLAWVHIRPAVCLERWPTTPDPRLEAMTTISGWAASDWIVDKEETYENTKRVAFLEFADLPRLTQQQLELALFLRWERDMTDARD